MVFAGCGLVVDWVAVESYAVDFWDSAVVDGTLEDTGGVI